MDFLIICWVNKPIMPETQFNLRFLLYRNLKSAVKIMQEIQNLVILGSTGSIGTSTLSVIEHNPEKFRAFALVGGRNVELMTEQCIKFQPQFVALDDENAAKKLRENLTALFVVNRSSIRTKSYL